MLNINFTCPKCGGHYFGTSNVGTVEEMVSCHDQFNRFCSWRGKYDWNAKEKEFDAVIKGLCKRYSLTEDDLNDICKTLSRFNFYN